MMEKEQFSWMCTLLFIPICILIGYLIFGLGTLMIWITKKIKTWKKH